jgi:DNA-binding SARP family transcriptional activator
MRAPGRSGTAGPDGGLQVYLLGGFAVAVGDRRVPDGAWRLRKARTLLKLLALAPGHRLHRDQVLEALWPDRDPAAAANNLHQVLHVARRRLDGAAGRRYLRLEGDLIALCPDDPLWIDAEAFAEAAARAGRARDPGLARAALALYRGELLPEDRYEDWTEPARRELGELRDRLARLAAGDGLDDAPRAAPRGQCRRRPGRAASRAG